MDNIPSILELQSIVRQMVKSKKQFGTFESACKELAKKYGNKTKKVTQTTKCIFCDLTVTDYIDKNGNRIGHIYDTKPCLNLFAKYNCSLGDGVYDFGEGISYCSDNVGSRRGKVHEINVIRGVNYIVIHDSNHNGIVDKEDNLDYNKDGKYIKTTIEDYLQICFQAAHS